MKTNKAKRSAKTTPKRYAQILKRTELLGVYLESCSATYKREIVFAKEGLEVSIRERASYTRQYEEIRINHSFYLTCKYPEMKKDFVIKISATFCLLYTTDPDFDDDFFDVFKEITLPIVSWPYFREFVQSMTQRMGIPPLTLPLIKSR